MQPARPAHSDLRPPSLPVRPPAAKDRRRPASEPATASAQRRSRGRADRPAPAASAALPPRRAPPRRERCRRPPSAAPSGPTPPGPGEWDKSSTKDQKKAYMKDAVVPKMAPLFHDFATTPSASPRSSARRATAPARKSGTFKMPNPALPKIPATEEGFKKLHDAHPKNGRVHVRARSSRRWPRSSARIPTTRMKTVQGLRLLRGAARRRSDASARGPRRLRTWPPRSAHPSATSADFVAGNADFPSGSGSRIARNAEPFAADAGPSAENADLLASICRFPRTERRSLGEPGRPPRRQCRSPRELLPLSSHGTRIPSRALQAPSQAMPNLLASF